MLHRLLLAALLSAFTLSAIETSPASATPSSTLSSSCVTRAQKSRIYYGTTMRKVRRLTGLNGTTVSRYGSDEVKTYPSCKYPRSVVVTFRYKRVVALTTRTLLTAADIDYNGTTDYWFDANADGYSEIAILDTNGNGFFETYTVEDSMVQGIFSDNNENGFIESLGVDVEKDGRLNWMVLDQNEDGTADWMALDLVGYDGIADTWVAAQSASSYTPPGLSGAQTQRANDMMVRQIVTMQQLRQFDPWNTNTYVPNGQTPSLLLPGTSPYGGCGAFCTP